MKTLDFTPITDSEPYRASQVKRKWRWLAWMPFIWPILLCYAIIRLPVFLARQKRRVMALHQFAVLNGFHYEGVAPGDMHSQLPINPPLTLPYDVAYIKRTFDRLTGQYRGQPMVYAFALMAFGTGRSDGTRRDIRTIPVGLSVLRVQLPTDVPNLLIESRKGEYRGVRLAATVFNEPREYVLEGGFDEYYKVIGESGEQIDIFTVLTPEVMLQLTRHHNYDIWMHDRQLLLISCNSSRSTYFSSLQTMFTTLQMLGNEVDRLSRSFRKSKV
jgi:hypothetical protein